VTNKQIFVLLVLLIIGATIFVTTLVLTGYGRDIHGKDILDMAVIMVPLFVFLGFCYMASR
jgi:hypothetical protein